MWKVVLTGILVVSFISTYLVIEFGLKPKSIPVIRPSNFRSPEQLGEYIFRQMYQVLNESDVLVFGIQNDSDFHLKVVEHLKLRLGNQKTYYIMSSLQAYHREPSSEVINLENRLGKKVASFVLEDLTAVKRIPQLQDCSNDLRFHNWMECLKENKLRQIEISKKVNLNSTAAVFERVSERSWAAFIRFPMLDSK